MMRIDNHSYSIRRLVHNDLQRLTELLAQLSSVGDVPMEKMEHFFKSVDGNKTHFVAVVENDRHVACACATLIIEPKLLHGGMSVGHIEDVVVDQTIRKHGIGRFLITHLIDQSRSSDCYKVILDCDNETKGFYEKCGMTQKGNCMAVYFTH